MKGCIFTSLFVAFSAFGFAQTDFSLTDYTALADSSKGRVGIWFENYYNSNVLNNSVYYNSVFKTGISRSSMQSMEGRALKRNIAGSQQTERLYYSWLGKKSNDSNKTLHTVNIGTRRYIHAAFGKDAFLLFGFGNKRFAGKTADLSDINVVQTQFSQIQYVLTMKNTNKMSYGVGASFLIGHRYNRFVSNNSYLYTSSTGDSVYLKADGYFQQSDSSAQVLYHPSGYGAAFDAFVSFPVDLIKNDASKGSLKIELNELGAIFWNNKSKKELLDGDIDWAGTKAPTIFEIGDSAYQGQVPSDIREELVSKTETGSFTSYLAPRIAIYYSEKLNENVELKNMIDYRFTASYIPYIGCTQIFRITKTAKPLRWKVNVYESLGGYGYFGLGIGIQAQHKKFGAILGSRHVIAMTNPEGLNGLNLHFGFNWNLY